LCVVHALHDPREIPLPSRYRYDVQLLLEAIGITYPRINQTAATELPFDFASQRPPEPVSGSGSRQWRPGWILALRGLVLMAAPKLYERAAMSMDAIPLVRLVFGVLVAIGLYLTYVGWLAKPASPLAKDNP
jgi:uncharacterized protein YjeT (DUF2065 family)